MRVVQERRNREPGQAVRQYLTFMIGGEQYALSLFQIKEVIEYETVTKIRDMPEWLRGMVRLRGGVVPVIDLALKLHLPAIVVGKQTCIVLTEIHCETNTTLVGIVADSASHVVELREKDVQQRPAFGTQVELGYLLGMARLEKKFCLLLDTAKLLSGEEFLQLSDCLKLCQNLQADEASAANRSMSARQGSGVS